MRICVDFGHTLRGVNTGAVGRINESKETRRFGEKVCTYLESYGHKVVRCIVDEAKSNSESLSRRVAIANKGEFDLFVSIHFNAGGGTGAEIFTYKGSKLPVAVTVLENLAKVGLRNRGIKDGAALYVVKNSKPKAMLVEVCFVDSLNDCNLYRTKHNDMVKAVAKGIMGVKA